MGRPSIFSMGAVRGTGNDTTFGDLNTGTQAARLYTLSGVGAHVMMDNADASTRVFYLWSDSSAASLLSVSTASGWIPPNTALGLRNPGNARYISLWAESDVTDPHVYVGEVE